MRWVYLAIALVGVAVVSAQYFRPPLPGHKLSDAEAIKSASDVVVATFTKLGMALPSSAGEADFSGAEIEIVSDLKGVLSGKVAVSYTVIGIGEDRESVPVAGTQYILFMSGPSTYPDISKILPATGGQIAWIKAMIAAATAPATK